MAFMDQGRLLFQESVDVVSARFREITASLGDEGDCAATASELAQCGTIQADIPLRRDGFVSDADVLQN